MKRKPVEIVGGVFFEDEGFSHFDSRGAGLTTVLVCWLERVFRRTFASTGINRIRISTAYLRREKRTHVHVHVQGKEITGPWEFAQEKEYRRVLYNSGLYLRRLWSILTLLRHFFSPISNIFFFFFLPLLIFFFFFFWLGSKVHEQSLPFLKFLPPMPMPMPMPMEFSTSIFSTQTLCTFFAVPLAKIRYAQLQMLKRSKKQPTTPSCKLHRNCCKPPYLRARAVENLHLWRLLFLFLPRLEGDPKRESPLFCLFPARAWSAVEALTLRSGSASCGAVQCRCLAYQSPHAT